MHDELDRGRKYYERRAWADAFEALSTADGYAALGGDDLELLATCAYLLGRDDDYLAVLDRAYRAQLDAGNGPRAARCAFWLGLRLMFRGERGRATGWLGRADRLIAREPRECVEQGYLLLPGAQAHMSARNYDAAYAEAERAAQIGDRFADADLSACARYVQGGALILRGQVKSGLAFLDEAMVAVVAGELSPLVTGLIYCSVIDICRHAYALDRAREWTAALTAWCERQPQMIAFTGICLVHRAEIMRLSGAWQDAIVEATRAGQRCMQAGNRSAAAAAMYEQGEVHRLRGDFTAAEEAYRGASQLGLEPQPGLAMLRLAQGRTHNAAAAIRRALNESTDPLQRARLLPAVVHISLTAGDIQQARSACAELKELASILGTAALDGESAHAQGKVQLAEGDPHAALGSLRRAWEIWHAHDMPFHAARTRLSIGLACRVLSDHEGSKLELEAARGLFEQLGAAPDVTRIDSMMVAALVDDSHGLTRRELQVLRLVAAGKTNKTIASELFLSQKTVDRHVSKIFMKLSVSSRAAATAYAYENKLI
jgi:DNA-binding CsgD family transcriptional regulator